SGCQLGRCSSSAGNGTNVGRLSEHQCPVD
ncbi:hypothetical protein JMJ77_0007883, partial [Colletotrichum scovillei]